MGQQKIFNDPVYGFVSIPYGLLFDLIEHPYFQRLRRIKQVSLTSYVYPGALHTRFHHALGALHLMQEAIGVLRSKGTEISEEEAQAVSVAILLHDIGHGPFSHTLEQTLLPVAHEEVSLLFMQVLNQFFGGALNMAIDIFQDRYHKSFLHDLISGQLDMDRMDYLNRDSFFTGVSEGVIGYDRIIKMLAVHEGRLVVEEKGIYSIEKFLIARRLMYWQVYLHKTVLAAEQMLVRVLERAKELTKSGRQLPVSPALGYFLTGRFDRQTFHNQAPAMLEQFSRLDDYDVMQALKTFSFDEDPVLSRLSGGLVNRRLLKIILKNKPFDRNFLEELRLKVRKQFDLSEEEARYLVFGGQESNQAYNRAKGEIQILLKSGEVVPMSSYADYHLQGKVVRKYYACYPKTLF